MTKSSPLHTKWLSVSLRSTWPSRIAPISPHWWYTVVGRPLVLLVALLAGHLKIYVSIKRVGSKHVDNDRFFCSELWEQFHHSPSLRDHEGLHLSWHLQCNVAMWITAYLASAKVYKTSWLVRNCLYCSYVFQPWHLSRQTCCFGRDDRIFNRYTCLFPYIWNVSSASFHGSVRIDFYERFTRRLE